MTSWLSARSTKLLPAPLCIIQEGFTTPTQFSQITPEEVKMMVKNLWEPRGNQPGIWIGAVPTKNLKALVWWAHEEISIDEFNEAKLEECIVKLEVNNEGEDLKVDVQEAESCWQPPQCGSAVQYADF